MKNTPQIMHLEPCWQMNWRYYENFKINKSAQNSHNWWKF